MKKFIAAVMAAAMVVSMAAVASFAAPAVKASVSFDVSAATVANAPEKHKLTLKNTAAAEITTVTTKTNLVTTATKEDILAEIAKVTTSDDGKYDVSVTGAKITFTQKVGATTTLGATPTLTGVGAATGANATFTAALTAGSVVEGKAATDLDQGVEVALDINGPYVDDLANLANGIVRPDTTMYYTIDQDYAANDDLVKLTLKKGDNSKNIESVKLVEKTLKTLYTLGGVDSTKGNPIHQYYVAVKTKPMFKDAEFKVSFEVKVSAKKDIAAGNAKLGNTDAIKSGVSFASGKIGQAWVNNESITGTDLELLAGLNGRVVKPVKGDDNEVLWTDANRDLAKMVYTADSDVNKYFPKLSTSWNNEFYGMHFDTDAFKMEFVTNPTISATARPVLSLYNPFINADGEYTTDAGDLIVYEVVEDELVLVSDRFTATTNDDGDQVLVTKTRTLGTYVITDAEAIVEAPATDVPAEKPVPNTGR